MDQTLLSAITQQRRRRILQIHHHHNQDHLHHYYYRSAQRYRQNAALLVHLADRALGTLPEGLLLKLGIVTGAQSVVISHRSQRHILKRRQVVNDADADLAAHCIGEALENLQFEILPRKVPNTVNLVGFVPSKDRLLEVVLKFVSADNSPKDRDECWVSTGIPMGKARFRKLNARGALKQL